MRAQWNRLVQLWESAQVELHGKYSTDRVLKLTQYARETSYLRAFAVILVTPLPCLVVTVLADPSEGVAANKMFFVRDHLITFVLTFICINQFRVSLPILPYPIWRAFYHAVWISGLCAGVLYGLSRSFGFPFPFSLMVVTPPWITLISISLAFEWVKKIRETPGAQNVVINVLKVWMCQVVLEFIYPPYYYIFTTLSDRAQTAFALFLPVIKLAMRNVFARTVVHLSDEMPEVIVFNVEVFNALFVSCCMQNSPSFWTTLELMLIDIGMIILSVRDMEKIRIGLKDLEQRIDERKLGSDCNSIGNASVGNQASSTLERTKILLEQGMKSRAKTSSLELVRVASHEEPATGLTRPRKKVGVMSLVTKVRNAHPTAKHTAIRVHPAAESSSKSITAVNVTGAAETAMKNVSVNVRYTRKVQRLLYLAEFLLLLNYVEIVIPLVFSMYMASLQHYGYDYTFGWTMRCLVEVDPCNQKS
ncbi:hypothetical protein PF008_g27523 [Phytophthora fragariae]|uniref:Uncharacterized protein n=1 Tax=Phytophthora fragariae TaxID=53985 RepID=A0A6G0QE23_9STRA|nr:hypothetical protein PF008_g27523 [Phytophthora fragariae]